MGQSIEAAWKNWFEDVSLKSFRTSPVIIIWGIWITMNNGIFQEVPPSAERMASQCIVVFTLLLVKTSTIPHRSIVPKVIDKDRPWGLSR